MGDRSFVPGYDSDVFISYARVNDEDYPRWVNVFTGSFAPLLQNALGGQPPRIWRDTSNIRRGEAWAPVIEKGAGGAALIITLLSRAYIKRPWCRKEIDCFAARRTQDDPLQIGTRSRIVPVWLEDLTANGSEVWPLVRMEREEVRAEPFAFYNSGETGESFRWTRDGNGRDSYQKELVRLTNNVATILLELTSGVAREGDEIVFIKRQIRFPQRPIVFVSSTLGANAANAETASLRTNIMARLTAEEINVVETPSPTSVGEGADNTVHAALRLSDGFVQLVEMGETSTEASAILLARRIANLAKEVSANRSQDRPLRRIMWLSDGVAQAMDGSPYRQFIDQQMEDSGPEEGYQVLRCDVRILIEEILKRLDMSKMNVANALDAKVYVAHRESDRSHAVRMVESLKRLGVRDIYCPAIKQRKPTEMNLHYSLLRSVDGVVVVYRDDYVWLLKDNVLQIDSLRASRKLINVKLQGMYEAPPIEPHLTQDPSTVMDRRDWQHIASSNQQDANSEPDPASLGQYVDDLRTAMNPSTPK